MTATVAAIVATGRSATSRKAGGAAADHAGTPEAPTHADETSPGIHAAVAPPVRADPPAMPPMAAFETPRIAERVEEETVINLAFVPRATEFPEADTVIRPVAAPRAPEPEVAAPPKPAQPRPVQALPPVSMSLPADSGTRARRDAIEGNAPARGRTGAAGGPAARTSRRAWPSPTNRCRSSRLAREGSPPAG